MDRKYRISPDEIMRLCEDPRRYYRQQAHEPSSTPKPTSEPEPEKKSFWGRVWDKTKKVCEEVSKAVIAVGTFVAGVAVMLGGAAKVKKNFRKLCEEPREKSHKKSNKKSHKKSRKNQAPKVFVGVWVLT